MQNGWARQDYAHDQREDSQEARDAARAAVVEDIIGELKYIGPGAGKKARVLDKFEKQSRDSAMDAAFDLIHDNARDTEKFSTALIQIWADKGAEYQLGDTPIDRLVNVINSALLEFAEQKAKREIQ